MLNNQNIFYQKKILIYGLGKTGLSAFNFLKNNNQIYLFDDIKISKKYGKIKKNLISYKNLLNKNIDYIIISPGIDINCCKLSNFLKNKSEKIYTDLDIFFINYGSNKNIAITGTNGKSTTAKILYEVLKDQELDVRLVGNIGLPILSEKKITTKTIFVIEASSYQLEYSKLFRSNISAILNISPDHLERHKTLKNYIKAKFRVIKNQSQKNYALLNTNNFYINKEIKSKKFLPKLIKVNKNINIKILKKINNPYFYTQGNKENLSFVFHIAKILKVKEKSLFKTLKRFKGLKYRQQIIHHSKYLTIINDSKATSFSSSEVLLKSISNIYWILGGLPKKGDSFLLSKNDCKNFKAYIFGKNNFFFINELKDKMKYQCFFNLKSLVKNIIQEIKLDSNKKHKTIIFSPAAASFDSFKNFEERGKYFNKLIKENMNVK